MDILTILEHTLQDGMSIEVIKEYRNKYKIRLYYNGEVADNIIIYKNFEAGREKARCRYAIDAAMALFYARKENYPEAKAWLSGKDGEIQQPLILRCIVGLKYSKMQKRVYMIGLESR